MFGYSLETIYLFTLIIIGCGTVLYLFFADVADASVDALPIIDPAIILSFITFTAAGGYLFERFTSFSSIVAFIIALIIATIFTTLVHFFLLVPLRSAEVSLAYTEQSLEGRVATVIVPIPLDGYGEIIIEDVNGVISKRAASYHHVEVPYDAQVLIIEVTEGTAYVALYDKKPLMM